MIVQVEKNISTNDKENLLKALNSIGYKTKEVITQSNHFIIGVGKNEFDIRKIGTMKGVRDIHRVTDDYKLVSKKWRVNDSVIDLGDNIRISRDNFTIMAGPCAIESEEQIRKTVAHLVKNNIKIMRGGVFKPRSSPYAFRGAGIEGLKIFHKICSENGIKIVTEVMQVSQIAEMHDYVDIFQVGARNSQNFNLLDELGRVDKAILLKRGMSGTMEELLYSAEYIFSAGNEKIMLCERGIRTFEKAYRNTLDLNIVPILKEKTHLPVIVDISHGIGIRRFVEPLSLAAVMAGADGGITEVHETPEKALSDGQQNLSFEEAEIYYEKLRQVYTLRMMME